MNWLLISAVFVRCWFWQSCPEGGYWMIDSVQRVESQAKCEEEVGGMLLKNRVMWCAPGVGGRR